MTLCVSTSSGRFAKAPFHGMLQPNHRVANIPRTKSGKITELAVREVVMGREVKNKEALANSEALELFRGLEELRP
jgi:hypothetical protein